MNALSSWRDSRGQAVSARSTGHLIQRAERVPGSVSLEELERRQRSYSVEFKPDLHPGSDLHWQMRPYGPGHWCRCDGQPHWLRTEAEAHAAGKRWIETGRTKL